MKLLCKLGIHKFFMIDKDKMPFIDKYTVEGILECKRCGHQEPGTISS